MTDHQTAHKHDEAQGQARLSTERLFCFHWEKVWTTFLDNISSTDVGRGCCEDGALFGSVMMLPAESVFTRGDNSDRFHDDFPTIFASHLELMLCQNRSANVSY